jgi:hypothetical protein
MAMKHPSLQKTFIDKDLQHLAIAPANRSVWILFFVLYLFYAVSPLSYTCAFKNLDYGLYVKETPRLSVTELNIFVWELIWSKLRAGESEDCPDSGVKILFRKARAILPEDVTKQLASQVPLSLQEASDGHVEGNAVLHVPAAGKETLMQQFFPLSSGLSPPLA